MLDDASPRAALLAARVPASAFAGRVRIRRVLAIVAAITLLALDLTTTFLVRALLDGHIFRHVAILPL